LVPNVTSAANAKVFLLGQVSLILSEGKPCQSAEKNPSTEVILKIYDYSTSTKSYHVNGRAALLKAPNVTERIYHESDQETVTLAIEGLEELAGFVHFSTNVNVESRLEELTPVLITNRPPKDEDECIVENIVKKQFSTMQSRTVWFLSSGRSIQQNIIHGSSQQTFLMLFSTN